MLTLTQLEPREVPAVHVVVGIEPPHNGEPLKTYLFIQSDTLDHGIDLWIPLPVRGRFDGIGIRL